MAISLPGYLNLSASPTVWHKVKQTFELNKRLIELFIASQKKSC
jgi:hypothetical protein